MSSEHGDISQFQFKDLVDVHTFSTILDGFFQATGIPNGLVGPNGELLSQAGWMDACEKFHRKNAVSNQYCQESNISLMSELNQGSVCGNCCKNGLIDYATPIVIEGQQLATLFLGQVLHTEPNLEFFRAQAKRFNYDEEAYIASILKIPVVDERTVKPLMDCLVDIAKVLAESGLSNYQKIVLSHQNEKIQNSLDSTKKRQIQLEDILDSSPVAIGFTDTTGKIEYVNRQFTLLFGYTLNEITNTNDWNLLAYPDEDFRQSVIYPWQESVKSSRNSSNEAENIEVNIRCKDGLTRRILMHASWAGEHILTNFTDISEHWHAEQRNTARNKLLELIAKASPLTEILTALVQQIESESYSSICSILLLDKEGKHLTQPIAPNLPDFYNQAVDGLEIGEGIGSCGTAAYRGERVIVENILTHEYWQNYLPLAEQAGVQACWSEPIISSQGKVLGSFAIYHSEPRTPSESDIEIITFAANLASIAIENQYTHDELKRQAYYDYLTGLANRRYFMEQAQSELSRSSRYQEALSIIMMDIDHFKKVNDTHGHKAGDKVLEVLARISLETLRSIDIIGRIGGEEFAIILPNTDLYQAEEVAERLRTRLAQTPVELTTNSSIHFTASLGVTSYNSNEDISLDSLLNQADQALYQAKNQGRNRVVNYMTLMSVDPEVQL